jgi:hypothetical protein
LPDAQAAIQQAKGLTTYEVAVPFSAFSPRAAKGGDVFCLAVSPIQAGKEKEAASLYLILRP